MNIFNKLKILLIINFNNTYKATEINIKKINIKEINKKALIASGIESKELLEKFSNISPNEEIFLELLKSGKLLDNLIKNNFIKNKKIKQKLIDYVFILIENDYILYLENGKLLDNTISKGNIKNEEYIEFLIKNLNHRENSKKN